MDAAASSAGVFAAQCDHALRMKETIACPVVSQLGSENLEDVKR